MRNSIVEGIVVRYGEIGIKSDYVRRELERLLILRIRDKVRKAGIK